MCIPDWVVLEWEEDATVLVGLELDEVAAEDCDEEVVVKDEVVARVDELWEPVDDSA